MVGDADRRSIGKTPLGFALLWNKLRSEVQHPMVLNLDISNLEIQELSSEYHDEEKISEFGIICIAAYLNVNPDDDNPDDSYI